MRLRLLRILEFLILLLLLNKFSYADSWTSSQPSHSTLYADTITSKTDASSVNIADSQGLFVTGDVTTLGKVGIGTTSNINQKLTIAGGLGFTSGNGVAPDTILVRDAANMLALRNGGNKQELDIYGTYTDDNNYERLSLFQHTNGIFYVTTSKLGTGQARDLYVQANGVLDLISGGGGARMTISSTPNRVNIIGGVSIGTNYYTQSPSDGNLIISGNVGIGTTSPTSKLHVIGKGTFTGGIDPPYVSFSNESHESIRQYAMNVEKHEKVMQFWNGKAHIMELYVIDEDKFYTLAGELIKERSKNN